MAAHKLTPPGTLASRLASPEAPAHFAGSFLVDDPRDGRLVTPVDVMTMLPLPLVPAEAMRNPNWHHHMHPRRSPLLQINTHGGHALRTCRIQRTDYYRHTDYHNAFLGPPLPEQESDKFMMVVMAAAGYMPAEGLDFNGGSPQVVALTGKQRELLQSPLYVKMATGGAVGGFIRHYVMTQDIGAVNISGNKIDEFLHTRNPERRRLLGHQLLALVTEKATESVEEPYYLARKLSLLPPGVPNNVQRFAKTKLGTLRHREKLVQRLHRQLAAA